MTSHLCPVKKLFNTISEIPPGQIFQSQCRQQIKSLLELLDNICNGRGEIGHIAIMSDMAGLLLKDGVGKVCADLGRVVSATIEEHRSVFLSHIEAHYCPSGECVTLSVAPCQIACPAGVDVPSYVALVGTGRYKEALEVLRKDLPLPGALSRVCVHPCEKACRRGTMDESIAICQLKRVAFDRAHEEGVPTPKAATRRFKEKIAIIGSGPAGLSTAYFLAQKGYRPTIFESKPEPGGMLRWWIPAFRLPRDILEIEIDYIKAMGVDIHTGITFGRDITLESIKKQNFQAVFIGVGAHKPMTLAIPGEKDFSGVEDCLTFLFKARQGTAKVGKRVMVIGGGNAAVDCARTALRLDVDEVHLVYRRTKREMPAHAKEVQELEEEGTILDLLISPIRIHGENGKVTGLECIRNGLSKPDATGRRRPLPLEGTQHILPADTIICAIGQQVDSESLRPVSRLELTRRHLITVDPVTMETSVPGVFAGGDVVTGPATVIEAVAASKKAAEAIHRSLRGKSNPEYTLIPVRRQQVQVMEISSQEKSFSHRPVIPVVNLEDRKDSFQEVELGMPVKSAIQEAKRCLRCDICISCGRCIEVCRNQMGVDAIHLSYVDKNPTGKTDFFRPAEYCIGCGACAENCPTAAITMQDKGGIRTLRMCGTEMARHQLITCNSCGNAFIPEKQQEFVMKRLNDNQKTEYPGNICPVCARKIEAKNLAGKILVY
ncbi:MAG: FAD-dependent oxidoreductase [Deltaproteobacteria bacterium]|nr:FAD-dependent oxidoreductase [Deltaproteobacteria bacterium]